MNESFSLTNIQWAQPEWKVCEFHSLMTALWAFEPVNGKSA